MISDRDIREQLLEYLLGNLTLDAFEDWIAQKTWNVIQWGAEDTQVLVYAIEAKLAEHSGGHTSEAALRKGMMPLVQTYVVSIGNPQPSTSSETVTYQVLMTESSDIESLAVFESR